MNKSKEELAIEYPQLKADINLCYKYLFAFCHGEKLHLSIPPQKDDYDMQISAALDELKAYRNLNLSMEELIKITDLKKQMNADHQPFFIKEDAISLFDSWNNATGAIPSGTSWYYECCAVIEEIAAMAFGAGIFYQSEREKCIKMSDIVNSNKQKGE